jgi:glycosyltransferase involved in cell wall biosynthesis
MNPSIGSNPESRRFSVIIPTFNRVDSLKRALDSVLAQDYPPENFEIIVANDGSTDGTRDFLGSFVSSHPTVRMVVVDSDRNYGIAHNRNRALKNASAGIIAYLDDDMTADKNWLSTLDAIYSSGGDVAVVGVRLVNAYPGSLLARYFHNHHIYSQNTSHLPPGLWVSDLIGKFGQPLGEGAMTSLGGRFCSVRKDVFERVGLYDERFESGEDTDFDIRVRDAFTPAQIYITCKTALTHYYKTSYFAVLRQFFYYGKGSGNFRKVRAAHMAGKPVWYPKLYTLNYILAISTYTKRNLLEFPILLFIAATTHLSQILGEIYVILKRLT